MSGGRKFKAVFLVTPVICLSIAGYFGYHAAKGMDKLLALQSEVEATKDELVAVQARRQALDHRISLLRPDSLDPDMLDERARAAVNAARIDDIVIFRRKNK